MKKVEEQQCQCPKCGFVTSKKQEDKKQDFIKKWKKAIKLLCG